MHASSRATWVCVTSTKEEMLRSAMPVALLYVVSTRKIKYTKLSLDTVVTYLRYQVNRIARWKVTGIAEWKQLREAQIKQVCIHIWEEQNWLVLVPCKEAK